MIHVSEVLAWVADWERRERGQAEDVALIETAGGVFSPLSDDSTNFDLALALSPAIWLLVAPDALGVLHELTATLRALGAAGRRPDHVVLSAARGVDASTGTNADELRRLGVADPAAVLRQGSDDAEALVPLLLK